MSNQFTVVSEQPRGAVIKVVGVGGGGCNALNYMVDHGVLGVEFIATNTDIQALDQCRTDQRIQLGTSTSRGLGAGSNPDVGIEAAKESEAELRELLSDTDMLFITAGMGGGTGTGAAPVLARIAKDVSKERGQDLLCVGVVTQPFEFEGATRKKAAARGIEELLVNVDSLIVIHNQRLTENKSLPLKQAFNLADEVLHGAVRGVAELITRPGMINVDFADVRTTMKSAGTTIIGSGSAVGSDAAQDAINRALSCPLLEDHNLEHAKGILCNITAHEDKITMDDYNTIGDSIKSLGTDDSLINIGLAYDNDLDDELRVTVVATGLCNKIRPGGRPVLLEDNDNRRGWGPVNDKVAAAGNTVRQMPPDYSELEPPSIIRKQAD